MVNPVLKKLGFAPTDRLVIIHADDIGMCHSTLPAIEELFDFGLVSSAAVMVPCPWFPGAAALARNKPDLDLGVHLTLNSEWEVYRWGPLTTVESASGLIDNEGYFFSDPEATQAQADLPAVQLELKAQIHRARGGGIDPTHVDTHMFCLGHPRLFDSYLSAGLEANTLPVVSRPDSTAWFAFNLPQEGPMVDAVLELEAQGIPMIDDIYMMNLDSHLERLEEAKQALSRLSPGITHFILHPAMDSPELRAMAPDWQCRVGDFEVFRSLELQKFITEIGVKIIGYKEIRDLIA
jgi:predicted glycoside hydrolase/deacetylase ChbG (UPF0249 family)